MHIGENSPQSLQVVSEEITSFVALISSATTDDLVNILRDFVFWKDVQFDIVHFIPVLNKFDKVLEDIIAKYNLSEVYTKPTAVESFDEEVLLLVLKFTQSLLEITLQRHFYNSLDRIYNLLNCTSLSVKLYALRICQTMAELSGPPILRAPPDVKEKILKLATSFPPPITDYSSSKSPHKKGSGARKPLHFKLVDWANPSAQYPSKWKGLDYEYFNSSLVFKRKHRLSDREVSTTPTKKSKSKSALNTQTSGEHALSEAEDSKGVFAAEGMQQLSVSVDSVKTMSFSQLYERAAELPQEYYFGYELNVAFAKAFNDRTAENLKIREQLFSIKCLAVGVACHICSENSFASGVLEDQPNVFAELASLVDPDLEVPLSVRIDVIHTLMIISARRSYASDMLKAFSGNVAHGLLFRCLKNTLRTAREGKSAESNSFTPLFFSMIGSLISVKGPLALLVGAGILNVLMEFLQLKSDDRRTRAGAVELISRVLQFAPTSLDSFISLNGFKHLIEAIDYEITFALENPDFDDGPPKEVIVSYSVSIRQKQLLKKLLRLVYSLINSDGGDRIRNLFDSPLLLSLNTILNRPTVFGNEVLASTLVIILSIMHNEPTAYSILSEAGTVDTFVKNFDSFLGKSSDLLSSLPEIIGAVCLNYEGMKKVLEADLITRFFKVFESPVLCRELLVRDYTVSLGNAFDELSRHYPDLKSTILDNVIALAENTPSRAAAFMEPVIFYHSDEGSLYESPLEEPFLSYKDGMKLPTCRNSEGASILTAALLFLDRLFHTHARWKPIARLLTSEEWVAFLTVPNTPYDFLWSHGMSSLNAILSFANTEFSNFALEPLLSALAKSLEPLDDMLRYDSRKSFFSQFGAADELEGGRFISLLGTASNVLFCFAEVYSMTPSLSMDRMERLCEFFSSDKGVETLKRVFSLFKRAVVEDLLFMEHTPASVISITRSKSTQAYPQLTWNVIPAKGNSNHPKFKNTRQLHGYFALIQTNVIKLVTTLLRPLIDKRQERDGYEITMEALKVGSVIADGCLDLLAIDGDDFFATSYRLLMMNFISCATYVKSRSNASTHTVLIALLFQNGGLQEMINVCKWVFSRAPHVLTAKETERLNSLDSLEPTLECVTSKLVVHSLKLFARVVDSDSMPSVFWAYKMFPGDDKSRFAHSTDFQDRCLTQVLFLALWMIDDLSDENGSGIFDCVDSAGAPLLPLEAITALTRIYESTYISRPEKKDEEFDGMLYPLSWKNAWPSRSKAEYLASLGVTGFDFSTSSYMLQTNSNLLPKDGWTMREADRHLDFQELLRRTQENPYVEQPFHALPSSKPYQEFLELRENLEMKHFDRWLEILKIYPSSVFRFYQLLGNVCFASSVSRPAVCKFLVNRVIKEVCKESEPSAPLLHLVGLLVRNPHAEVLDSAISKPWVCDDWCFKPILSLIEKVNVEDIAKAWFPKAMFVYECVLSDSMIPVVPEKMKIPSSLQEQLQTSYDCPHIFRLSDRVRKSVFEVFLKVDVLPSFESALALARVLVLYSKDQECAERIVGSLVLTALVSSVYKHASSENWQALQSCLIVIVRQCMETNDMVKSIMSHELKEYFSTPNKKEDHPPKAHSLNSLLKDATPLIVRSNKAFLSETVENLVLEIKEDQTTDLMVTYGKSGAKTDEEPHGIAKGGVMTLLLEQLMDVVTHNDIYCSTEEDRLSWETEKKKTRGKAKMKQDLLFKNKECLYVCFLLQAIVELLFSYEQSKMEFLTYSKKRLFSEVLKPRSTALNFLVYQLVPTNSFSTVDDDLVFERKHLVSTLAKTCVLGLVSSVATFNKTDASIPDANITLIRKFTVDILMKVMKDTSMSIHTANSRYGKIDDLLELTFGLINDKREHVIPVEPKNFCKYDAYHVARIMVEKGFPGLVTGILAGLDLNYPNSGSLTKDMMKIITRISAVILKYQDDVGDQKVEEGEGEDIEEDDMDDSDETPNLLRNSTLGMYDIDDVSEDEEIDYSDGSSVVNVVYSTDGSDVDLDSGDDEEMLSGSEIDIIEDSENDYGDPIESDDDGHFGSDESRYDDDPRNQERYTIDIISEYDSSDMYSSYDEESDPGEPVVPDHEGNEPFFREDGTDRSDEDSLVIDIREFEDDNLDSMRLDDDDIEEEILDEDEDEDEEDEEEVGFLGHVDIGSEGSDGMEEMLDLESNHRHRSGFHSHRHELDLDSLIDDRLRLVSPLVSSSLFNSSSIRGDGLNPSQSFLRNPLAIPNDGLASARDALPHFAMLERNRGRIRSIEVRPGEVWSSDNHIMGLLRAMTGRPSPAPHQNTEVYNLAVKSTLQRWIDVVVMFNSGLEKRVTSFVARNIVDGIYEPSVEAYKQRKEAEENQLKLDEAILQRSGESETSSIASEGEEPNSGDIEREPEREPVYILIGDREVDISGTDIDPEFFEALPDEIREEVFTQHIRERRAEASAAGNEIPEIDPSFLSALPDNLREEILAQEAIANRYSALDNTGDEEEDEDEEEDDEDGLSGDKARQKPKRIVFPLLIDRFGVASLLKLVFVPQSYADREYFMKALGYLCYNKQSKADIMGLLLYILQEATADLQSSKKVFHTLSGRAKVNFAKTPHPSPSKMETPKTPHKVDLDEGQETYPVGCTPLIVTCQAIDTVQYLLEYGSPGRLFFLNELESTFMSKRTKSRHLKAVSRNPASKYPINVLLGLLNNSIVKQEPLLIDTLSRTLQVATRPLQITKSQTNDEKAAPKTIPIIPDRNLRNVTSILVADECNSKVFQQTVGTLQNLSSLENARNLFPQELSRWANVLANHLVVDLKILAKNISNISDGQEMESATLSKFMLSNSDQVKFLRVLTALDYLFDNNSEVEELKSWYRSSSLGPLWGALSDVLKTLRDNASLSHIATVMSPLIEALLVVCKHSKVNDMPIRDVLKYEETQKDFVNEPLESLFFSFTDEHKKILNHMVRANPKLMSGPFSMLVRNSKVLEFDSKRVYFEKKLHENAKERQPLHVNVRRDQVFLDSYRSLFYRPSNELKDSKLDIQFRGEAGVDAGGVTREWFQVLSRQMFNPDYALFTPVASDTTTFHPNRTSYANPEHLSFFKFIGKIIGKALYDGFLLDCHFSRAVYKRILGRPLTLKDVESLDPSYFKSLIWMLENDITDVIEETFSVESDDFGEHKVIDLIENGHNIPVTEDNKKMYVSLIVEYRLNTSVEQQMDSFLEGFHQVIPKELVSIFDDQELELLISGLPDIDVDDWRNNTVYQNYSPSSPQIQWFWRAVKSFDVEERAKLLQFATGTSKVPLHGFKELSGVSGVSKFSIHKDYGSSDRLPSSHTCFNQIDLPEYASYDALRGSLLLAITEGHEGFGLA
ncbi:unnamed protein product [Kuraishia capsulata CBS 1993]|uniref:HECT-type E3 ubiquitin transferase n=1 Tax=Kuraishia capsulata CBS 1993 TaxID=1382522 RepID=W6MGL0_9ASCO|nr:uncharacterized protein KUCA_T00000928001 [Kuraishia capsulata CBS 1993]CDK24961.1 unnamed protein product [Kuraishia capsulata CBS 1993]